MTERRIRLAFVGGEHLHFARLLGEALAAPNAEVVGFAIADDELRAHFAAAHPAVPAFASGAALYAATDPEAIITCADNVAGAEIAIDAAARGLHVMKEKPMAASLALAEAMLAAVTTHGTRLMVNWPNNWTPALHLAGRLVAEGAIGRVWQVRYRSAHGGPPADAAEQGPVARVGWAWLMDGTRNGAGAAIDYCGYGAVVSRWLMGQPERVMAMGGRYVRSHFTVDDNAVMVLGYPAGQAIVEASWSYPAVAAPIPPQILGERGAIAILSETEVSLANQGNAGEHSSTDTARLTAPALPVHMRSAPAYFCHCLLHGEPFAGIVGAGLSRDAQAIMEAGLRSMASGAAVALPQACH